MSGENIQKNFIFNIDTKFNFWENPLEVFPTSVTDRVFINSLLLESCHFLTMLPHHASNKRETTALFLRVIELFNYFIEVVKQ
jgi:hypothetical protein